MKIFNASEIMKFAIKIEEKGETFYKFAVGISQNEEVKKLFSFLADEEAKHKASFEQMQSQMEGYQPPEKFSGEYEGYMNSYLENIIFPKENWEDNLRDIKDEKKAINFGIRIELDSILYYHEIKPFVPKQQLGAIDEIIEEERKHFLKLLDIKRQGKDSL